MKRVNISVIDDGCATAVPWVRGAAFGAQYEPARAPTTYEKAGRRSLGWSCCECGGHLDLACPFGNRCFHAGART